MNLKALLYRIIVDLKTVLECVNKRELLKMFDFILS